MRCGMWLIGGRRERGLRRLEGGGRLEGIVGSAGEVRSGRGCGLGGKQE